MNLGGDLVVSLTRNLLAAYALASPISVEEKMVSDFDSIGLVEAIQAVRQQLKEAATQGASEELQLEVEQLELEFTVELKRDLKVKGGIKAWVISADAEAGVTSGKAHKVKVSLAPKNRSTGDSVKVGEKTDAEDDIFGTFTK